MMRYHVRRWDAIILAVLCWVIACAFSVEKVLRDGVQSYALLIAMPVLAIAAGVLIHEAWFRLWHRWNPFGAALFGSLALCSMAVTLPISIGNSAASTDLSVASIQKATEDHALLLKQHKEAETAVAQAQRWVAKHCKGTLDTDTCRESRTDLETRTQRLAAISGQLLAEKPATGSPSGDKRIAWVLNLLGFPATQDDVALGWPILPPAIAEVLSAVFLAMGLSYPGEAPPPGSGWRRSRRDPAPPAITAEAPAAILPPPESGTRTKQQALADLLTLLALGETIPSQDWLRERWNLGSKGTVSKWLADWEEQGFISRSQVGRCKAVETA